MTGFCCIRQFILRFTAFMMIASWFWSCKNDTIVPSNSATYLDFFPLHKGFWVQYSADSVVHLSADDSLSLDTAIRVYGFEIREEVDSAFIDGEGDSAYSIARFKRMNDTLPWEIMNIWTAKITSQSAERVEDNIRYIKLSFPISYRAYWNGNAYNMFEEEDYQYDDIYNSMDVGNFTFDSTVTVIQNDFISDINRISKLEIYANHVGMVYKQLDSLKTMRLPNGSVMILTGNEYRLTLNDYKH